MGLADELFEANQEEVDKGYDELGLKIWDKVDYIVARAILLSVRNAGSRFSTHQLHLRQGVIFYDNLEVEENLENIYRYAEWNKRLQPGDQVKFWRLLKQHLPEFNTDIIQVSENLFWDKANGKMLSKGEVYAKFNIKG